jgi:hypothetical protein
MLYAKVTEPAVADVVCAWFPKVTPPFAASPTVTQVGAEEKTPLAKVKAQVPDEMFPTLESHAPD